MYWTFHRLRGPFKKCKSNFYFFPAITMFFCSLNTIQIVRIHFLRNVRMYTNTIPTCTEMPANSHEVYATTEYREIWFEGRLVKKRFSEDRIAVVTRLGPGRTCPGSSTVRSVTVWFGPIAEVTKYLILVVY